MAVSYLTYDNDLDLKGKSISVKSVNIGAVVDSSDTVLANPSIEFSDVGSAYITSGDTLRFGKNAASAGFVMNFSSDGTVCNVNVNGTINSNNSLKARGKASWSGGGSSVSVAVAGVVSSDHVHITTTSPATEPAAEFSHAVAGTGEITVHLKDASPSNTYEFNYLVYPATS